MVTVAENKNTSTFTFRLARPTEVLAAGTIYGLIGSRVCMGISEFSEGTADLNGDGDVFDTVLHIYDASSGKMENFGVATFSASAGSSRILTLVSEAGQGSTDLNGDGDALDQVVHMLSLPAGQIENLGLAGTVSQYRGPGTSMVAFGVSEFSEGRDLNGDGDIYDVVVHTTR